MPIIKALAVLILTTTLLLVVESRSVADQVSQTSELILQTNLEHTEAIILPVTINGKRYKFLLDAGATFTMVANQVAEVITQIAKHSEIPIYLQESLSVGLTTLSDPIQKSDIKLWRPLSMEIGNEVIPVVSPWLGRDLTLVSQAIGQKIDGILGVDIFRLMSWAVHNDNKTLSVWKFEPFPFSYQRCYPYDDSYGDSPIIKLGFEDKSLSFAVDTGADYSVLSVRGLEYLHEIGLKVIDAVKNSTSATLNGAVKHRTYFVEGLSFQEMPIGRFLIDSTENDLGNLGMNFFARFDDYVFVPSKMLFCYNVRQFTHDEEKLLRGISLRYFGGYVELFYNDPSELSSYGLKNGDRLLSVNGQSVEPVQIDKFRKLLSVTPAGKLKLQIERDNKVMTISL